MGICDNRVVIITGAGRGLGRAHAMAFAAEGAKVVVNDVGAELDGSGGSLSPAQEVVEEIRSLGGDAIVNGDDISDWDQAGHLIAQTIEVYGRLDTVVCNAGIVRDRMIVNMSVDEWDAVMKVHLRGMFCPVRHAIDYWRAQVKAGSPVQARVVTTSSGAGLFGSVSQGNYSAAKAGIAGFTIV
ncbi:MAG: SDR family NAD(P)-dependent oxidoreductase, partial [Actinobacteria bacterium]|nr:SDR family NAD(P)-dependent oxidoreductase [Actinomycetota bacterium]